MKNSKKILDEAYEIDNALIDIDCETMNTRDNGIKEKSKIIEDFFDKHNFTNKEQDEIRTRYFKKADTIVSAIDFLMNNESNNKKSKKNKYILPEEEAASSDFYYDEDLENEDCEEDDGYEEDYYGDTSW